MASHQLSGASNYPADLVRAVAVDAARDACRVARFLEVLGLGATPDKPRSMPAGFLLLLGAALRLMGWEEQGFSFHRGTGLPDGQQALSIALESLCDPNADPTALCIAVLRIAIERFACRDHATWPPTWPWTT